MGNKRLTNAAILLYRICIVGLFALVWFSLYNKYTFQTYRIRGGLVSVLIFYIVYSWLCNVYSAYRVASSSIGDIIFKQFVSFAVADFILYMECCLIYNQYVNIIPGAITVVGQLICTVLITFFTKRSFMKHVVSKKTLVIYGKKISKESALHFEKRLLYKYSHLFRIVSTERADIKNKVLEQYMKTVESVILYEVEDKDRGRFVQACLRNHKNFYYTPQVDDILATGSSVRHLLDTPLMKYDYQYEDRIRLLEKRIMDIILSLFFIILTSPIMLITAICIKFEDGGPVFYRQKRHTKNMKVFEILKFRSMKIDAERYGAIPATQDDPRITKVGKVIRKVRIDELPQFFNILKGDMSFVGPRPERVEHTELYSKDLPEFTYRLRVKGGLTGYAQIFGKYNTSAHDKLLLDLMYIENQSLLLDIKLILLTIRTVFEMESTEGFDEAESARMNQVMAEQNTERQQILDAVQNEKFEEEKDEVEKVVEDISEEKAQREEEVEKPASDKEYWLDAKEGPASEVVAEKVAEETGEKASKKKTKKKTTTKKTAKKTTKKTTKKVKKAEADSTETVEVKADEAKTDEAKTDEAKTDKVKAKVVKEEIAESKNAAEPATEKAEEESKEEPKEEVDIEDLLYDIEAIQSESYRAGRSKEKFKTGFWKRKAPKEEKKEQPVYRFDEQEKDFKNVEAEKAAREKEKRKHAAQAQNLSGVTSFIKKNLTEEAVTERAQAEKAKKLLAEAEKAEKDRQEEAELDEAFDEIALEGGALTKAVGKARSAVDAAAKEAEEKKKEKSVKAETKSAGDHPSEANNDVDLKEGVVTKMNLDQLANLIKEQEARMPENPHEFVIPEKPGMGSAGEKTTEVSPVEETPAVQKPMEQEEAQEVDETFDDLGPVKGFEITEEENEDDFELPEPSFMNSEDYEENDDEDTAKPIIFEEETEEETTASPFASNLITIEWDDEEDN